MATLICPWIDLVVCVMKRERRRRGLSPTERRRSGDRRWALLVHQAGSRVRASERPVWATAGRGQLIRSHLRRRQRSRRPVRRQLRGSRQRLGALTAPSLSSAIAGAAKRVVAMAAGNKKLGFMVPLLSVPLKKKAVMFRKLPLRTNAGVAGTAGLNVRSLYPPLECWRIQCTGFFRQWPPKGRLPPQ